MTEKQILDKKNIGDNKIIAQMLGISQANVSMILSRPKSKRYHNVIKALTRIVEAREALISDK